MRVDCDASHNFICEYAPNAELPKLHEGQHPKEQTTVAPTTTTVNEPEETTTHETTLFPRPPPMCLMTFRANITWPPASLNELVEEPCPDPLVGVARWRCELKDERVAEYAGQPDLSACRHDFIDALNGQLDVQAPAQDIVQTLDVQVQSNDLNGADVKEAVSILRGSVELAQMQIAMQPTSQQTKADTASRFTQVGFRRETLRRELSFRLSVLWRMSWCRRKTCTFGAI